jgi:hypothetical protein
MLENGFKRSDPISFRVEFYTVHIDVNVGVEIIEWHSWEGDTV